VNRILVAAVAARIRRPNSRRDQLEPAELLEQLHRAAQKHLCSKGIGTLLEIAATRD